MDPETGEPPQLVFPDFMDFQDYVNPVFRLELLLQQEIIANPDDDGPPAP
jgi:hypothetical protein